MPSPWRRIGLVGSVALPAVILRLAGAELRPEAAVVVFGAGVVASAFLLAWAAEAAQVDIPLSSEAPELIIATLYALRMRGEDGLGTLLSAKVNQWTLLVAVCPSCISWAAEAAASTSMPARPRSSC